MNNYSFALNGKDNTPAAFKSARRGLGKVNDAVFSLKGGLATLAGAAGFGLAIKSSLEFNDTQAKTADRLGANIKVLSGLGFGLEQLGGSQEGLNKGFTLMNKNLGELALRGTGVAKPALDAIGLSINDIKDLAPEEQFLAIGDAMQGLGNAAEKAFVAQSIFGRSAADLLPLLDQGADGMQAFVDEADRLGVTIDRVDAAKIEQANDAMNRSRRALGGIANQVTLKLAPFIEFAADKFTELATDGDRTGKIIEKGMGFAAKGAGVFADGLRGIDIIFKGTKIVAQGFAFAVTKSFELIIDGAFFVGQAIIDTILFPLREAISVAAIFSDTAADALVKFDDLTTLNKPGFVTFLSEASTELANGVSIAQAELQKLLLEDLPSAVIEQKMVEILARAQSSAEVIAENVRSKAPTFDNFGDAVSVTGTGGASDVDAKQAERLQKEAERDAERLNARLLRIEEGQLTELEKLRAHHAAELETIRIHEETIGDTKRNYALLRSKADDQFKKKELELANATEEAKKRVQISGATAIASFAAGNSKKLFKLQKLASLAQAAVSLPPAIIQSFQNGGGYPWGLIPAAAMALQGAQQIAAIKNQTFGTGGGNVTIPGGGGGGGASSVPTSPGVSVADLANTNGANQNTASGFGARLEITFNGAVFGDPLDIITSAIAKKVKDEGINLVDIESPNGQELIQAALEQSEI